MRYLAPLLGLLCLIGMAAPASADVVHKVSFKAEGMAIVWGETLDHNNLVAEMRTLTPTDKRLAIPLVQTGQLVSAERAAPLAQSGKSRATFNVASNTGFAIRAQLANLAATSDLSGQAFSLHVSNIGAKAQSPHSAGWKAGRSAGVTTLADLQAPRLIYQGDQKTAAARGSIADQSVTFSADWENAAEANAPTDIIFTVFVP